jgi:large subunit ribosomal protein L17
MRHSRSKRKLGRTSAHRQALFRNQLDSLIEHERIVTTLEKAKELRPLVERIITRGKDAESLAARRWVRRWFPNRQRKEFNQTTKKWEVRDPVRKVFDEIAPRFKDRPGGYTRIVKLGARLGDGGEEALIEFVDYELKGS